MATKRIKHRTERPTTPTWDDRVAAHEHRLDQARRSVRTQVQVVVHHHTAKVPIVVLKPQPSHGLLALQDELVRVHGMLGRTKDLAEAAGKPRVAKQLAAISTTVDQIRRTTK